ncbi:transcription factor bHLH52-like [Argentina anserina]|uniref:transcription factor bHLH52-like n=1 Tax=Argentina anserina TaxID=57926 RepID=UPI0021767D61|nr:transcription factor bHLH52-like [Potentilla anserina]
MAAMSTTFCSDWGSLQLLNDNPNPNNPDYDQLFIFQTQQHELAAASILGLDYSLALDDPNPLHLSQTFFSDPEFLPALDDLEYYYHDENPKRQKTQQQFHSGFNGFVPNPSMLPEFVQPQLPLPPPEIQIQQLPSAQLSANCALSNKDECTAAKMKANSNGGVSLSPQSIAARERRRKITEKTGELGRLVPSGSKMNTAEMLQAAHKYIKFLKAQVSMLKFMDSVQVKKGQWLQNPEGLQVLASPIVQEKLYSEEKCLVSRDFVETLANNQDIQSNPLLKDYIAKLL